MPAPLAVHRVELLCQFPRAADVVRRQAFDAERHVRQPPRRIQARPQREAEVEARRVARIAPRRAKERGDAGLHAAAADSREALRDEHPVVAVELDDIGYGAERDEIEQAVEPRFRRRG
jgi:hypothetical protein